MFGVIFLFICLILMGLMVGGFCFVRKEEEKEDRSKAPLERGFATTGRILRVLSLQFLVILILFLVFDLEVVLVVALVFRGRIGQIRRRIFVRFIVGSLWAEWAWGKLFWAL